MTAQNTNNNRNRLTPFTLQLTPQEQSSQWLEEIWLKWPKPRTKVGTNNPIPFHSRFPFPYPASCPSQSVLSINEGGREGSCEGKTIEMDQIFPSVLGIEEQKRGDLRHWRCLNLQSGLLQIWNSYHSAMCSAQLVL